MSPTICGNHVWAISSHDLQKLQPDPKDPYPDILKIYTKAFHVIRDVRPPNQYGGPNQQQLLSFKLSSHHIDLPDREETEGFYAFYLIWDNPPRKVENNGEITIKFYFYILNRENVKCFKTETFVKKFTHRYYDHGESFAFGKKTIETHRNDLYVEDSIRFGCTFEIQCDVPQVSHSARLEMYKDLTGNSGTLGACFQSLRDSGDLCDVTLVCEGVEFRCHKIVLAARSDVFRAMFSNHYMKESQSNMVNITDSDPETVSQMLDFLYTDQPRNMYKYALGLLPLADKYNLPRLRLECERYLSDNISQIDALDILLLADKHSLTRLTDVAVNYVALNIGTVKEFWSCQGLEHKIYRRPDIVDKLLKVSLPPKSGRIRRMLEHLKVTMERETEMEEAESH